MKKSYKYTIWSPSGNDTALVSVATKPQAKVKKAINSVILSKNKSVEQVGFLWQQDSKYFLEMAGGEFCGNASRCAIWEFLKGQSGEMRLHVSGIKLKGGINKNNLVWVEMPIIKLVTNKQFPIAELPGITHLIVETIAPLSVEQAQLKAREILKKNESKLQSPALGVIFFQKYNDQINLQPVVWVRSINTFFYETACGSGTAALGYYLALKKGEKKSKVIQPSGQIITVTLSKEKIIISGKVGKVSEKTLSLLNV